ncbi:MAG: hypothetical protein K0Q77_48 [Anaerosporomusa subterranea]|jgi:hypothetical protein|nr:hypothetical protein [Anaerosporomusa subterranea]MDF2572309.1 hypothetical protein [Sporomusa sp.]
MKKQYCPYCGAHLNERCGCERELAEAEAEWIEEYENRPDTQAREHFNDILEMWRNER